MGPSIAIESNNINPSHNGNTYPFDLCYFRSKKIAKMTLDGLRLISNMSNISFAMGMFSYQN